MDNVTATIAAVEPEVLAGLSPLNWAIGKTTVTSAICGAAMRLKFQNTRSVQLEFDTSNLRDMQPSRAPVVAWSLNGEGYQSQQLSVSDPVIRLANECDSPLVELYIKGMSPFEDRYHGSIPANSVTIKCFLVDADATVTAQSRGEVWLNIGDSIMSGDAALCRSGEGRPLDHHWATYGDARASYGYLLARHFGFTIESRLAYGGYQWAPVESYLPSLSEVIDNVTSCVSRLSDLKLKPAPKVVAINLGENAVPTKSDVIRALRVIRSRVAAVTKMIVLVPVSGRGRSEICEAISDYCASTLDNNTCLVDAGDISFDTADGQHPTTRGHEKIYQALLPAFRAILARGDAR